MIDFLDSIKIQEMVKNIYETGQNPASAEKVAEEVYELLQRIPLI